VFALVDAILAYFLARKCSVGRCGRKFWLVLAIRMIFIRLFLMWPAKIKDFERLNSTEFKNAPNAI